MIGASSFACRDWRPKMDVKILKNLFKMVYGRDLDHYRYTPPAAATADCLNAVRRWCRCSR